MNDPTQEQAARAQRALDAALARQLAPPALPPGFRERLRAAIARAPAEDLATRRRRLEQERREALDDLRSGSVRVGREVLGLLLLGAFTLGAVLVALMPWLRATFGPNAGLVVVAVVAVAALGYALWVAGRPLLARLADWLP